MTEQDAPAPVLDPDRFAEFAAAWASTRPHLTDPREAGS